MTQSDNTNQPYNWKLVINLILIGLGGAVLIAYLVTSFVVAEPPFDYAIVMRSAAIFCYDQPHFEYGISIYTDGVPQRSFYPAPFYSAFCVPHYHTPELLLIVWLVLPFLLAVWLAGWRAAVLAYPPLFLLLLLGQSTAWLLPLYILAAHYAAGRQVRWWHGLFFGVAIFKPHVALPAVLYLLYRWRRHYGALIAGVISSVAVVLPAFLIMPDWIQHWLPNGRGFEPANLATIARVPVQLFDIPFAPSAGQQALVWGFALLAGAIAFWLIRRRQPLTVYDGILLYAFALPLLNDYDLIILLPFIAQQPRRLLLAAVAGIPVWLYALMSGYQLGNLGLYNMSVLITLVLLAERILQPARTQRVQNPLLSG
jgi:hypothetical protein